MQVSLYHKFLRVSAVTVALMLLFENGTFSPVSKQLADNAIIYVANTAIGVNATVPPNEYNTITAALTAKQKELDAREAALNARTIDSRDFNTNANNYPTYILSAILSSLLTFLIIINYILDWKRVRSLRYEGKTA